jgi:adenylate cyclase
MLETASDLNATLPPAQLRGPRPAPPLPAPPLAPQPTVRVPAPPLVPPAAVPLAEAAFLFADIVGFTAYTETHGDSRAAELAWRLRLGVEAQLGHDAHVVKTLGDAVMVRLADPAEAAAVGLRIVDRALPGAGDPPLRVGVHCGAAVECDGDFFGRAVNVAARVAALAQPGEVLVTDDVAMAARGRGMQLDERGAHALRNVSHAVALHAVGHEALHAVGHEGPVAHVHA